MRHTLVKLTKVTLFIFVGLYFIIWAISPPVIRHYLSDYLSKYNVVVSDDTAIRYNPFLSHLSIRDLTITKKSDAKTPVLTLASLDFELRLYQIIFDNVYVSEFIIDGLFIKAKTVGKIFEIAGFTIPESSSIDEESPEKSNEEKGTSEPVPYKVELPKFTLSRSTIALNIDEAPHELKFNSLVIESMGASVTQQSLNLAVASEINGAPLNFDLHANLNNGQGNIDIDLSIEKVKLARFKHFLPENITKFEGDVSYQAKHKLKIDGDKANISISDLQITSENVHVIYDDINLILAKEIVISENLALLFVPEQLPQIEGSLNFALNDFSAFFETEENTLAAFEKLDTLSVKFEQEEKALGINIADINLYNAYFSDDINNEIPALAKFDLLNINNIKLSQQGIAVNEISFSGIAIDAQLSEEKELLNLVTFTKENKVAETESVVTTDNTIDVNIDKENEQVSTDKGNAFAISLNRFYLADEAHIHFTDNSVKPSYQRHLALSTLEAGPIDNQKPAQEIPFNVVGKSDKYAHLNFTGSATPFTNVPQYKLKGAFKEVSLPGISGYIKDALGYEIQSGQLDLGLDIALDGTELDGEADILLRGIELTAADDHEAGSMKDQTSVPFNIALGMLKDSDGNVELSLPLSGDTSNPSFGVSGLMTLLIKQATMSAAKDYLMTTFVPYASVINIALAAGEFVLEVRVNDLPYPAAAVELQASQQEFIDQFSALMREKDDVQLKLCAIATAADIGKAAGTELSDKADIEKLKAISMKRTEIFKDYMVEQEKISSSRLLLCTPQIDSSKDAKPRLTFET